MGKTFETLDSVDSEILTKVKITYSNWLPVVLVLKLIPVLEFYSHFDVFWFRIKIPVSAARLWLLPVQVRYIARPLVALSCCTLVALQCCNWM